VGTEKRERQKEGRRARLEEAAAAQQKDARKRRFVFLAVAVVVIGGLIGAYALLSDDSGDSVATETTTTVAESAVPPPPGPGDTISGETPCPAGDGSSPRTTSFENAPPLCLDPARQYTATFTTDQGDIKVALDTTTTPDTANNFAVLSNYHYYDDTAIFRTSPSLGIIQGGAPITNGGDDPGPGYTIDDEGSGYTYQPGQLVMARTQQPNSAGAQYFFVADAAASSLDAQGTYVVFGQVTEGLEIVQQILASGQPDPDTAADGTPDGTPVPPAIVTKVTIEEVPPG
jgi:cyclophilin family peptidyl-prolyl cis-trans isomerase